MLFEIAEWLVYSLIGMSKESKIAEVLSFFIYDSLKITLLLFFMIALLGFLRTFIPEKKLKKLLGKSKSLTGNFAASLFGAITPFCSCSSIPMFISFLRTGIPLGVTFSFLITSPIINEYLVVIMLGFFGWKITVAYVASGILIGVVSGRILGNMNLERYIEKDIKKARMEKSAEKKYASLWKRFLFGFEEAKSIIKKLWLWILLGVALGAVIHNYLPQQLINSVLSKTGIFTVPLAVLIGVPMYGGCAAIVPIAVALFQKGIPLGTVLSFMMAVSALSLPEAIILRRAMKLKLILIFFGIVALTIILTGYLFNILQGILI